MSRRRSLSLFLIVILLLGMVLANGAPSLAEEEHVHTPDEWVTIQEYPCYKGRKIQYCGTCGDVIADIEVPAVQDHSWGEWSGSRAYPCEENCIRWKNCTVCGAQSATEADPPTAQHAPGKWNTISPQSCMEPGIEYLPCTVCGENVEERFIDPLPHTPGEAEDCTTPRVCTVCEAELPALGHDLEQHAAKAATCTEIGWDAYETCTRCDYSTYAEIVALDHDLEQHAAKAATCTEIGWDAYETCTRCDYSTYAEIAALGHEYVERHVAGSCTMDGYYVKSCDQCGEQNVTLVHKATGHKPDREATCVKDSVCTACGQTLQQALGTNGLHGAVPQTVSNAFA